MESWRVVSRARGRGIPAIDRDRLSLARLDRWMEPLGQDLRDIALAFGDPLDLERDHVDALLELVEATLIERREMSRHQAPRAEREQHRQRRMDGRVPWLSWFGGEPYGDEIAEGEYVIVPAPRLAPTEASRRWAALVQQIFEVDPLACPACHGTMRIVAFTPRRR